MSFRKENSKDLTGFENGNSAKNPISWESVVPQKPTVTLMAER